MKKATHIYFEQSPNPNSLKFVLNYLIVPEGVSYDFPDIEATGNSPLAEALFGFSYVKRVFFMNNFITLTKDESVEWIEIRDVLKAFILDYLDGDQPVIREDEELPKMEENESELDLKIRMLLEEYVKPAVEQDGGAIEYHSFKDGTVKVLLQGSCSGCPSSMLTLKAGIENLLKTMVPEVKSVEAEGI
jgi:Fe-S cluster biogenesis protein NfuA